MKKLTIALLATLAFALNVYAQETTTTTSESAPSVKETHAKATKEIRKKTRKHGKRTHKKPSQAAHEATK